MGKGYMQGSPFHVENAWSEEYRLKREEYIIPEKSQKAKSKDLKLTKIIKECSKKKTDNFILFNGIMYRTRVEFVLMSHTVRGSEKIKLPPRLLCQKKFENKKAWENYIKLVKSFYVYSLGLKKYDVGTDEYQAAFLTCLKKLEKVCNYLSSCSHRAIKPVNANILKQIYSENPNMILDDIRFSIEKYTALNFKF